MYKRDATIPLGDCFRWAYHDVIENGGTLVQGYVIHPWNKKAFQHAWVERNGKVYDWQTIVMQQQPPIDRRIFRERWNPHNTVRYSAAKAARHLLQYKNFGPWTCAPYTQRDPFGPLDPKAHLLLSFADSDGYIDPLGLKYQPAFQAKFARFPWTLADKLVDAGLLEMEGEKYNYYSGSAPQTRAQAKASRRRGNMYILTPAGRALTRKT